MDILVGIDFGTTNTVITQFINNKVVIIMDGIYKIIPSKIGYVNDKVYCGNYIPINCNNIISNFKITNLDSKYLIIFFKHLYDIILKNQAKSEIKAVITVPSNFSDIQREIIKASFNYVNINVIRMINEPTAAALAYGLNYSTSINDYILVIDTGGGTMDFTILEKTDNFFEIVYSYGLNDLGGNNFTDIIYNDMIKINDKSLWKQAQQIKEKLTYLDYYEINNYTLTKIKFENMSNNLINKIKETLIEILNSYSKINYIILVGGTSRIPFLFNTIKTISNKKVWIHPNLETVVAEGAGLYAGIIEDKYTLTNDILVIDVVPLSLGIELADGTFSIIIPKNTPLPVKRSHKYLIDTIGETNVNIKVYQGERKIANKNILIGEFNFDKITKSANPIIEIIFKIDLNSIINMIIIDKKTNVEKNIIIKDIPKIEIKEDIIINITDDEELLKLQHIYLINQHIENSLINLQYNELISELDKTNILNKFKLIEKELESMNNLLLIETLSDLKNNYSILGTKIENDNFLKIDDNIKENKTLLYNKINLLLGKNPEWKEYLEPILEELTFANITNEYINDKLIIIEDLEKDDVNYKEQLNNLCLYLKNQLETGEINMSDEKNKLLGDLINENLILLNEDNLNWEDIVNTLNSKCLAIYN